MLERTLPRALERSAELHPDAPCLLYQGIQLTYREVWERVEALAAGLHGLGVRPGDRVGVNLPNCPEFVIGYFAALRMGATALPLSVLLKPSELQYALFDSGARAVISLSSCQPLLDAIRPGLAELEHLIVVGGQPAPPYLSLEKLVDSARGGPLPAAPSAEQVAAFFYTSGTTGYPKAAMLTHRNIVSNVGACLQVLPMSEQDRFGCVLPLFHSFAATVLMALPLSVGASVLLLPRFSPESTLQAISEFGCSVFGGVPSMYQLFLQVPAPRPAIRGIRVCISGGAPLPAPVLEGFEREFGVRLLEGYGPTENSPVVSVNPWQGESRAGSVGLPLPGQQVRIFDDQDRELPVGEVGEVVVRGPSVMAGYYRQPEETEQTLRGGWLHTGDLGRFDSDGYLYIVDRKKELVIVAGLNVYPREVENAISLHPAVAEVVVVGVQDSLRGEVPVAVVAARPGMAASEAELLSHCRQRLAGYKVPRRVEFRAELPRTATGKLMRRELREELNRK